MKIESQDLLHQYYLKVRDKYPDLSFDQFKLCCITPFEFVKQQMSSGNLPSIRIKNLGIFTVSRKRAQMILFRMEKQYAAGNLSEEIYTSKKAMIEKYLRKHEG